MRRRAQQSAAFLAFVCSIFLANWLIANFGETRGPGMRVIPVGFGMEAPSGVMAVGLGLTARDVVHELSGPKIAVLAVVAGALLSAAISPALAIASGGAFLISEGGDLTVYARLRRRGSSVAVLGSNVVGALLDSVVFLGLAFGAGSVGVYWVAQTIGKLEWSLLAVPVLLVIGRRIPPSMRGS